MNRARTGSARLRRLGAIPSAASRQTSLPSRSSRHATTRTSYRSAISFPMHEVLLIVSSAAFRASRVSSVTTITTCRTYYTCFHTGMPWASFARQATLLSRFSTSLQFTLQTHFVTLRMWCALPFRTRWRPTESIALDAMRRRKQRESLRERRAHQVAMPARGVTRLST